MLSSGKRSKIEHLAIRWTPTLLPFQMVDDHEELLSNSVARLERIRYKHERLSKIFISVKAGVEHLQDKLKNTAAEVNQFIQSPACSYVLD